MYSFIVGPPWSPIVCGNEKLAHVDQRAQAMRQTRSLPYGPGGRRLLALSKPEVQRRQPRSGRGRIAEILVERRLEEMK
jgi:hypothetical protein